MADLKDKTGAERQRRYRQNKTSNGYTRLQLYVPDSAVDQIMAIAEILTNNPSVKFTQIIEATKTQTYPLPLTAQDSRAKIKKDRYVHPSNPLLMWSGRGRQPTWVMLWIEQGGKLEELENTEDKNG